MQDEQRNDVPQVPSNLSGDQASLPEGSSRRGFLKAAVITTAAVAGAGAATAAVVTKGPSVAHRLNFIGTSISTPGTCSACITGSQFLDLGNPATFTIQSNGQTNPGTFYLFLTIVGAVPGWYKLSVSPDPATDSNWEYASNGNNVFVYTYPAGTKNTCPHSGVTDPDTVPTGATLVQSEPDFQSVKYHLTSTMDLQFLVHIKYHGPTSGGTFQLTVNATRSDTEDGTYSPACADPNGETVTIIGTPATK
jgi:hypothetical protein